MPFWFTKCGNAPKLWPNFPSPFPLRKAEPIEREKRRKKVLSSGRIFGEKPTSVAEIWRTPLKPRKVGSSKRARGKKCEPKVSSILELIKVTSL